MSGYFDHPTNSSPAPTGVTVNLCAPNEYRTCQRARLHWLFLLLSLIATWALTGCSYGGDSAGEPINVWGRRGISKGRLQKPRAITIDGNDQLYIVDMTARIQAF